MFSWQRLNTPGALARGVLSIIKEVRATGPLTVEIETMRPFPILLNALTQMHIMDAGWAAANNATAATNLQAREETGASRAANGTGPFRIVAAGRSTGRPCWNPIAGWWDTPQHNLTEVTFQPIRSAPTRTAALLGGQVDALVELPLQDIPRIEANPNLQVVQGPELRTIYLGFDHFRDELVYSDVHGRNPLRDIRVRQAIYQAIDVEALRRSVMRGNSWIAGTMASPFLNGAPHRHQHAQLPLRSRRGQAAAGGGGLSGRLLGRPRLPERPLRL